MADQLAPLGSQISIDTGDPLQLSIQRDCFVLRGSTLYLVVRWVVSSTVFEWRAYSSTDYGATWSELDPGNRPQFTNTSAVIVSQAIEPARLGADVVRLGDNLWCCCLSNATAETVTLRVFRFDMSTETWSQPPAGPAGQHISQTSGDTSVFALWNTHRHLIAAVRGTDVILLRNFLFSESGTFKIYPTVSVFSTVSETWTASLVKAVGTADTLAFSTSIVQDADSSGDIYVPVIENKAALTAQGGPVGSLKLGKLSSANVLTALSTIVETVAQQDDSGRLVSGFNQPHPYAAVLETSPKFIISSAHPTQSQWTLSTVNGERVRTDLFDTSDVVNGPWSVRPLSAENFAAVSERVSHRSIELGFMIYVGQSADGVTSASALNLPIMASIRDGDVFTGVDYYRRNSLVYGIAVSGYDDVLVGPSIPTGRALIGIANKSPDVLFFEPVTVGTGDSAAYFI